MFNLEINTKEDDGKAKLHKEYNFKFELNLDIFFNTILKLIQIFFSS